MNTKQIKYVSAIDPNCKLKQQAMSKEQHIHQQRSYQKQAIAQKNQQATEEDNEPNNETNNEQNNETNEMQNIKIASLQPFPQKNTYSLCHVYQPQYVGGKKVTGFGDFIRGTFFILHFCDKYNFNFQISMNHPIAEFLKNTLHTSIEPHISSKVSFCETDNFKSSGVDNKNTIKPVVGTNYFTDFIDYLGKQPNINNTFYTYNIIYSNHLIPQQHKDIVKAILEPCDSIKEKINTIFDRLSMVKQQFIVIHVRTGDKWLIDKKNVITKEYLDKLIHEINIVQNANNKITDFYLLSDNTYLKTTLIQLYPSFKTIINEISHLGEGIQNSPEIVKNNFVDFCIMSNAYKIFSFTVYEHGTGFSKWCSSTYDIPYRCKLVK